MSNINLLLPENYEKYESDPLPEDLYGYFQYVNTLPPPIASNAGSDVGDDSGSDHGSIDRDSSGCGGANSSTDAAVDNPRNTRYRRTAHEKRSVINFEKMRKSAHSGDGTNAQPDKPIDEDNYDVGSRRGILVIQSLDKAQMKDRIVKSNNKKSKFCIDTNKYCKFLREMNPSDCDDVCGDVTSTIPCRRDEYDRLVQGFIRVKFMECSTLSIHKNSLEEPADTVPLIHQIGLDHIQNLYGLRDTELPNIKFKPFDAKSPPDSPLVCEITFNKSTIHAVVDLFVPSVRMQGNDGVLRNHFLGSYILIDRVVTEPFIIVSKLLDSTRAMCKKQLQT